MKFEFLTKRYWKRRSTKFFTIYQTMIMVIALVLMTRGISISTWSFWMIIAFTIISATALRLYQIEKTKEDVAEGLLPGVKK